MIPVSLLKKLKELYEEEGLEVLKQEIKDRKLQVNLDCSIQSIVDLVLEVE